VSATEAALAIRGGLLAAFPARVEDAVRMTVPDGAAFEVREAGLRGAGRIEQGAIVYDRDHDERAIWSATDTAATRSGCWCARPGRHRSQPGR
jgi:hypothetical protein